MKNFIIGLTIVFVTFIAPVSVALYVKANQVSEAYPVAGKFTVAKVIAVADWMDQYNAVSIPSKSGHYSRPEYDIWPCKEGVTKFQSPLSRGTTPDGRPTC
jgi:hypothetical protein